MIEYLLVEHPLEFIVLWDTTVLAGYVMIRKASRSMSLEDQVKYLNENREGRSGKDVLEDRLVENLADGEPEMATRLDAPEHIPDWMDKR